jgi:hypothetical protein
MLVNFKGNTAYGPSWRRLFGTQLLSENMLMLAYLSYCITTL